MASTLFGVNFYGDAHRIQKDVTYPASRKLFENFSTPREMAMADVSKIESIPKNIGFYRVKAGRIKEISEFFLRSTTVVFLMIWKLFLNCLELAGRLRAVCVLIFSLIMPLQ